MSRPSGILRARRRRSRWLAHAAAVAFLAVLAGIAQRNLLRHATTHVYAQEVPGNDSLLHVWTLAWDHHVLTTAPERVFDANVFHPQPGTLLYSDHLLGLAALLAPLRLLTDNPVLVHNVAVLGATALNAVAMYLLALDLTGRIGPALVGAVIYAFAPFRFGADRHQVQMLVAWWLPLLLLAGRRTLATGGAGWAALCGLALGLQALTGIYLTAFFAPFLALAHAWWLYRFPLRAHAPGWRRLVAAEVTAVIAVAPTLVAYRDVQAGLGIVRSLVVNARISLHLARIPEYLAVWTLLAAAVLLSLGWRSAPRRFRSEAPLLLVVTVGATLLAFGPALPLPSGHGWIRGPYALLLAVPGYDALRAPARMLHVALLGAAGLAAGAVAGVTAGHGRLRQLVVPGGLIALALAEGVPTPFPLTAAPPPRADPVVAWLARIRAPWRLAELPLGVSLTAEVSAQYASIGHWKRILNGTMGIVPPIHPYMARRLGPPIDPEALAELRTLDITHLLVRESLGSAIRASLEDASRTPRPPVKLVRRFPRATIWALRPGLSTRPTLAPGHALSRRGWRPSASADDRVAALAIGEDSTTAWRSWGGLERRLRDDWHDRTPFLVRWDRLMRDQPARLTITLPHAVPLAAVEAVLGGSDPEALATIGVETSLDGAEWTPVDGLRPVPDARALVTDTPDARFLALAPAPRMARHVRLTGAGEWQVRDLQLYGTGG